jgi:hypothetical protein
MSSDVPIQVAAPGKAWVYGRLMGLWFESRLGHGCPCLVSVVCCQVEVSATGRSLVQRSPTECGVSERDLETSIRKGPSPTRAVEPWKKSSYVFVCIQEVI